MSKAPIIHATALVNETAKIGPGSRVWAFVNILGGVTIGDDCNVCDHCFIETGVLIGNRVTIKCGVFLWAGIEIEDDVFIGPAAVFTNDLYPRSKKYFDQYLSIKLKKGCTIGANATILPNIEIGEYSMIAAGAIVTKSVLPYALMVGTPAKHVGWVCVCGNKIDCNDNEQTTCECSHQYCLCDGKLIRVKNEC